MNIFMRVAIILIATFGVFNSSEAATLHVGDFAVATDTVLTGTITDVLWADFTFTARSNVDDYSRLVMAGPAYSLAMSFEWLDTVITIDGVEIYRQQLATPNDDFYFTYVNNMGANRAYFSGWLNMPFGNQFKLFDFNFPPSYTFSLEVLSNGGAIFGDYRVFSAANLPYVPEPNSFVVALGMIITSALLFWRTHK